jgi:hypothetical protein
VHKSSAGGFDWDHPTHPTQQLFRKVSLAGIEPVGFRVKSDLRNHQAIVQPRWLLAFFWGSSFNDGTTQTALDPPEGGPVRTH